MMYQLPVIWPALAQSAATQTQGWGSSHGARRATTGRAGPSPRRHDRRPPPAAGPQVHNKMLTFGPDGKPVYSLSGAALVRGESDGSSFPNGGLRATHTAAGYTAVDPTSPVFMRGDTLFVPAVFISWTGHALDEKAPLLRSMDALRREGVRLLAALGYRVSSVVPNIGLEQEFFLVPRDAFARRPDLQLAGRTVLGRMPARGQEMSDHYMAPVGPHVLRCMQEIQDECFRMGIPLRTRHREVSPHAHALYARSRARAGAHTSAHTRLPA